MTTVTYDYDPDDGPTWQAKQTERRVIETAVRVYVERGGKIEQCPAQTFTYDDMLELKRRFGQQANERRKRKFGAGLHL